MTALDRPSLVAARDGRLPWLHRVHPLAKFAGTLPVLVALFFVRDLATPLVVIVIVTLCILSGARLGVRGVLSLLVGVPAALLVLGVSLGLWVDPAQVGASPVLFSVGPWPLYLDGWMQGLATAARMLAIVVVALFGGIATAGADVVRSMVQYLRVPYRFGYAALAAFRFVPRFRTELETIRRAHRVRGIGGRGPVSWVRGQLAAVVPLVAAALRHADRVSIAMEARAFGSGATRTERHPVPFGVGDVVFTVVAIALTVAVLVVAPGWHEVIAAWVAGVVAPGRG